jgi:hypothetical protein
MPYGTGGTCGRYAHNVWIVWRYYDLVPGGPARPCTGPTGVRQKPAAGRRACRVCHGSAGFLTTSVPARPPRSIRAVTGQPRGGPLTGHHDGGGAIDWIIWQTGTAGSCPGLMKGRKPGPGFVTDRRRGCSSLRPIWTSTATPGSAASKRQRCSPRPPAEPRCTRPRRVAAPAWPEGRRFSRRREGHSGSGGGP